MADTVEPSDVIVEDVDSRVTYFPPVNDTNFWPLSLTGDYHGGHLYATFSKGAYVSLSFVGKYFWYFSGAATSRRKIPPGNALCFVAHTVPDWNANHGNCSITVDGNVVVDSLSSFSTERQPVSALYGMALEPGQHEVTVTNLVDTKVMGLDYFAYRPLSDDESQSLLSGSQASTTTPAATSSSPHDSTQSDTSGQLDLPHSTRLPLPTAAIVGIVLAIIAALLSVALMTVFLRDRRRKRYRHESMIGPAYDTHLVADPWTVSTAGRTTGVGHSGVQPDMSQTTLVPFGVEQAHRGFPTRTASVRENGARLPAYTASPVTPAGYGVNLDGVSHAPTPFSTSTDTKS